MGGMDTDLALPKGGESREVLFLTIAGSEIGKLERGQKIAKDSVPSWAYSLRKFGQIS